MSFGILIVGPGRTTRVVRDYREFLGRSHGVDGRILASVNGSAFSIPVPLVEGSVSVSAGTGVGRSLSAVVRAEPDDVYVDPWVTEWQAQYGFRVAEGMLWVPVGTFALTDAEEAGRGRVAVKGLDRWSRVADARFERARTTSGDTVTAIVSLLQEADSRIIVDTSDAPTGSHRRAVWDRDRDKAVQALARSLGARVRFTPDGVARVEPVPSIDDEPFWSINRGRGGAKIRALGGTTTRGTRNAVVVVGESPGGDPVYGIARDTKPTSKTRYGGFGGKRPRFYSSDLITTTAQANAAAAGLLASSLRVSRTLTVEALPHPGLDAGHVIDVETRPGVWERHMAGSFDVPLGPGSLTIEVASAATEGGDE